MDKAQQDKWCSRLFGIKGTIVWILAGNVVFFLLNAKGNLVFNILFGSLVGFLVELGAYMASPIDEDEEPYAC